MQSPFVLATSAGTLLSAIVNEGLSIAIRFNLIIGCGLKRERFVALKNRYSLNSEAGYAKRR